MQLGLSIDHQSIRGSAKIKAALTCPICSLLLQSPVIRCEQCGNYFCQSCLSSWWTKQSQQNICIYKCYPTQLKVIKREGIFQPMFELLEFPCQNPECEEVCTYETVKKHMEECQWKRVKCQYCEKKELIRDVLNHHKVCEMFPELCSYCKKCYVRKEVVEHEEECWMRLFECQNEGCESKCLRGEIDAHKLNCLYQSEHCRWCAIKLIHKQLLKHIPECPSRKQQCIGCKSQYTLLQLPHHQQTCIEVKSPCPVCSNLFSRKQITQKHSVNQCMINEIKQLRRQNVMLRESNVELKLMMQNLSGRHQELQQKQRREKARREEEQERLRKEEPKNMELVIMEKDFQRLDYSIGSLEKLKAGEFSEHMKKPHLFGDWCPICKQIDKKFAKMIEPLETQRKEIMEKLRWFKGKEKEKQK